MTDEILNITDWRHPFPVEGIKLTQPWYYPWHPYRLSVDQPLIKKLVGDLEGKRVLDVACNDGWYAFRYAQEGADAVGIDGRQEPIDRASLIKNHFGLENLSFIVGDIEDRTIKLGQFDITLFYGILYHLADPIHVLRRLGEITNKVISVQTFINAMDNRPTLRLFREAVEIEANGLTNLVTMPSQAAVVDMLLFAGFDHVYRVIPPAAQSMQFKNSNPDEQWAFFLGVKGNERLSGPGVYEITVDSPPLNQFGITAQLMQRLKRQTKRMLRRT